MPDDSGWARFLEIVTNTESTTVTYSLNINTNLGSDGSTYSPNLERRSTLDRNDRWIVTDDVNGIWDPTMLHVFGGEDGVAPAAMARQWDNLSVRYDLSWRRAKPKSSCTSPRKTSIRRLRWQRVRNSQPPRRTRWSGCLRKRLCKSPISSSR